LNNPREQFLKQVRQAVADGNRAGVVAALPQREAVGYQGAGPDPVARFVQECSAAGGHAHIVADSAAATCLVANLVREHSAHRVLLGRGTYLDTLDLGAVLSATGVELVHADKEATEERARWFQADLGISGVDAMIAETGTIVLGSSAEQPRLLSLLPPVHIAVAHRGQLLADLFDLFTPERLPRELPSGLALITGPSKTGDIELRLVTGVHGPGNVHVVLVDVPLER
jgi:L-lactate utilization protein LutC